MDVLVSTQDLGVSGWHFVLAPSLKEVGLDDNDDQLQDCTNYLSIYN